MKTFYEVSIARREDTGDAMMSVIFDTRDEADVAFGLLEKAVNLTSQRRMIVMHQFKNNKDDILLEDTIRVLKKREMT